MSDKYFSINVSFNDLDGKEITADFRIKNPNRAQISRCLQKLNKDMIGSLRNLVFDIIHPEDKENFKVLSEQYSGIAASVGNKILEGVGFDSLGK